MLVALSLVPGIASGVRHPGVAIGIAHSTFPDDTLAPAAILLLLLIGVLVTSTYGRLRSRGAHTRTQPT